MLQGFLSRFGKNRERFDEMESEVKMQKLLEQKQKNSDERELERFMEEERQKEIKKQLELFRAKRREEDRQTNMLKSPTVFNHASTIKDDKNILGGPSFFMRRGNL